MSERITDERLAELVMYHETRRGETAAIKQISDYHGDEVAALRELASLRGQVRWIPVTQRLPLKPNTSIVFEEIPCIVTDGERVCVVHYQRGGGHVCDAWAAWSRYGDIEPSAITAWRPMPEIGPLPGGEG